jgi:hypothetical protein
MLGRWALKKFGARMIMRTVSKHPCSLRLEADLYRTAASSAISSISRVSPGPDLPSIAVSDAATQLHQT